MSLNITIDGERVKQVKQFKYLGSLITENGSSRTEIRSRICMAKVALTKKKALLIPCMEHE